MAVRPIPAGYHSVTPYLIVDNATQALEFYQKALNARELCRLPVPGEGGGQKIGHAEISIGDSQLMLSDEYPEMRAARRRLAARPPVS